MTTKFKQVFDDTGLKQNDLAARLNVTPQTITHWLKRGLPKARIFEVAGMLGVPIPELIEGRLSDRAAKALKSLPQTDIRTAKELMSLIREDLYSMPIGEIYKLIGHLEQVVINLSSEEKDEA